MMLRKRLSYMMLFMSVVLSGCAAGELVGKVPVIENINFATVNILRPSGIAGCGVRMTVQIDYKDFYELACGDRIAFRVPADRPVTISQTTSHIHDDIQITPKLGSQYYYENDCNGWACWLHEATESRFHDLAKKCTDVKKIDFDDHS